MLRAEIKLTAHRGKFASSVGSLFEVAAIATGVAEAMDADTAEASVALFLYSGAHCASSMVCAAEEGGQETKTISWNVEEWPIKHAH